MSKQVRFQFLCNEKDFRDQMCVCVCLQSVVYCHGGRIGFYQGDIRLLPDDMKALRPTIFPVVPRLLNRMYDKVSTDMLSPHFHEFMQCR